MAGRSRSPGRQGHAGRRQPHYARSDDAVFRVPPSDSMPKRVFITCHYCAYSPPGDVPEDGICPKCGSRSWQRYALAEPLVPAHMKQVR